MHLMKYERHDMISYLYKVQNIVSGGEMRLHAQLAIK
jgi:hypothetical protein